MRRIPTTVIIRTIHPKSIRSASRWWWLYDAMTTRKNIPYTRIPTTVVMSTRYPKSVRSASSSSVAKTWKKVSAGKKCFKERFFSFFSIVSNTKQFMLTKHTFFLQDLLLREFQRWWRLCRKEALWGSKPFQNTSCWAIHGQFQSSKYIDKI